MASCSIFKNFHKPIDKRELLLIADDIASDKYKVEVEKIRSLLKEGKAEEAQELKKKLPAFTPSAVFKARRVKEEVEMYTSCIHLDFDKLRDEQIAKAKEVLSKNPQVIIVFISPSGHGIKLFVEVTTGIQDHDLAYQQVQEYYEDLTGLKADPSCKDITRLCFVSYDPELYMNLNNKKFVVKRLEDEKVRNFESNANSLPNSPSDPSLNEEFLFKQQVEFTDRKNSYKEGSRNNYIYMLASNCNRVGLPEIATHTLISRHFDLSLKEIKQTVKSAFTHHPRSLIK
jgi:hypothetical protein